MARIHARTKGKSGSQMPATMDLSFVTLKPKEVEELVVKMSREDAYEPSKIGLVLRDKYAVPSVKALCGKSISKILEEAEELDKTPEDLRALVTKATALKKHLAANPRDEHNKRGLLLIESRIRRLSNYYKRIGRIDMNWSYNK